MLIQFLLKSKNCSDDFSRQNLRGQGLLEYALIILLIVIAVIGTLGLFGVQVQNTYQKIFDAFPIAE